jgi:hypothetical protein
LTLSIPWKNFTKGLPRGRQTANDREPTFEEISKTCRISGQTNGNMTVEK